MHTVIDNEMLLATQLFYPELISTGQSLTELSEALSDLGVKIQVICAPPTLVDQHSVYPKELIHHGIRVTRVWSTRFPKLHLVGKLLNHATFSWSVFWFLIFDRSQRPLLVPTNPPFLIWACVLALFFRRRKLIYVLFDLYPETPIAFGLMKPNGLMAKIWRGLNQIAYRKSDVVVVIGRCMQRLVKAPAEKTRFIPLWVDTQTISDQGTSTFREEWGLVGKRVVLYSGNMARFHDFDTFLGAAKVLEDREDIVFVFVGDGYARKSIENSGLRNCQVRDYVSRSDLGKLLRTADVGLVSLKAGFEGFSVPSKTFGIMAAGVPVVAVMSDKSEIAQLLQEYEAGCVVPIGDVGGCVSAILSVPPEMGRRGAESVKMYYTVDRIAAQYLDCLDPA